MLVIILCRPFFDLSLTNKLENGIKVLLTTVIYLHIYYNRFLFSYDINFEKSATQFTF